MVKKGKMKMKEKNKTTNNKQQPEEEETDLPSLVIDKACQVGSSFEYLVNECSITRTDGLPKVLRSEGEWFLKGTRTKE
jgi:hypothetical protein